MEIKTVKTVDFDEINREFGRSVGEFDFTEMVENDSYVIFDCDDCAKHELFESIEWERDHGNTWRLNKLMNDLALLNVLREIYNITDEVLIYVSW